MRDWKVIAQFDSIHEASDALTLLESADIPVSLVHVSGSIFMKPFDFVGSTVKLCVMEDKLPDAIEILISAGYIRPQDLGPDSTLSMLERWLDKPWVHRMFGQFKKITLAILAGLLLLILLILISEFNGRPF